MTPERGVRTLAYAVAATVLAAVVAALVILGTPKRQRQIKLDERRVDDLINIQREVNSYWNRHKALPSDLAAISGEPGSRIDGKDPERGTPYEFEATGLDSFRLCATFTFDSSEEPQPPRYISTESWSHGAGRQCFDLNIPSKARDDSGR